MEAELEIRGWGEFDFQYLSWTKKSLPLCAKVIHTDNTLINIL
jgi:hypothetical protein